MKLSPRKKEWEKKYRAQEAYLEEIKNNKASLRFAKNKDSNTQK